MREGVVVSVSAVTCFPSCLPTRTSALQHFRKLWLLSFFPTEVVESGERGRIGGGE